MSQAPLRKGGLTCYFKLDVQKGLSKDSAASKELKTWESKLLLSGGRCFMHKFRDRSANDVTWRQLSHCYCRLPALFPSLGCSAHHLFLSPEVCQAFSAPPSVTKPVYSLPSFQTGLSSHLPLPISFTPPSCASVSIISSQVKFPVLPALC